MAERRRRIRSFEWSTAIIASISIAAGVAVYLRDGTDKVIAILTKDLELLVGMLPKMAAGCLIAAFVTRLLPREVVARWSAANPGSLGLLVAMTMGAVLPGGPLTIYPVAGAFLVLGADVGTAVAFITAWNLLGYNRALIWELPFFGPEFVGWRVLIALPLPILGGLLARFARAPDRPARGKRSMDLTHIISLVIGIILWMLVGTLAFVAAMRSKTLFREGAFEGGRDFIVLIPRVMVGVVGSGYIAAIMPQDLIATWIGPNSGVIGILIGTIIGAADAGRRGRRLRNRRRRTQERRRRAAGDRLFDRLVALYHPAAAQLGDPHDGAAFRVAARGGIIPIADIGRARSAAARQTITTSSREDGP